MKTPLVVLLTFAGIQIATAATPPQVVSTSVLERGANHEVVQTVRMSDGTFATNQYTRVGNGINYQDANGNWVESSPVVQAYPGGIVCTGNSYRVILSANLNVGNAVDLETDSGQRIVSRPLGIALYDPESGQTAWLAQITNCSPEIVSSNQVVYHDAFQGNGISASVTYTYGIGHFHQDVTFSSALLPDLSAFQMSDKARLEILTELVQADTPAVTTRVLKQETNAAVRARMAEPDVTDDMLRWGNWMMTLGRAYLTGKPKGLGTVVAKKLVKIGGATVLVESVDWKTAQNQTAMLPKPATAHMTASADAKARAGSLADLLSEVAAGAPQPPAGSFEARLARAENSKPVQFALNWQSSPGAPAGFVMDYDFVSSCYSYTFSSGNTYVITSDAQIGHVTIQSGAFIKLGYGGQLEPLYSITCPNTGPKAVITDVNDDSVGQTYSSSAHQFIGYQGVYALNLDAFDNGGSGAYLQNLDIRFVSYGIQAPVIGNNWCYVYDDWFFKIVEGVLGGSASVFTSDFCDVDSPITYGAYDGGTSTYCAADRNGNGLPDSWEMQYFSSLSQGANDDPDGDYVSNYQEYLNGSDPTSSAINVSRDLLLIYNSNSSDSYDVCAYYLAHRPMASGANVLGIACTTHEAIQPSYFASVIAPQVQAWLANHAYQPQYVILFPDLPSQVNDADVQSICGGPTSGEEGSVQYNLKTQTKAGWSPFVTSINMEDVNACKAYINKLADFGASYSPNQIYISANQGGYGNTKYYFDDAGRIYSWATPGAEARDAVIQGGIPSTDVTYVSSGSHITSATDVAAYMTWGANGGQGKDYATDGSVVFTGSSAWYLILTIESFNGQRCDPGQGTFLKWFSAGAFGGSNYSNTPIGAVTHVEEPYYSGVNDRSVYFGLWVQNKDFAICAWESRRTTEFQAVGDPFVIR